MGHSEEKSFDFKRYRTVFFSILQGGRDMGIHPHFKSFVYGLQLQRQCPKGGTISQENVQK